MLSKMAMLAKTRALVKTLNPTKTSLKSITTFTFLSQEPQLADPPSPQPHPSPLPPNPATGSPLYNENWRNPTSASQSVIGFLHQPSHRVQAMSQTLDAKSLMDVFADFMTSQNWIELKQLFESWVKSLDKHGKPNKPDVNLYNHYLRANLMIGASAGDLLDLVAQMDEFAIEPNTATFNIVLKAMYQAREAEAATKLIDRMMQMPKESQPDSESFDLVVGLLFLQAAEIQRGVRGISLIVHKIDEALKYVKLTLKSGLTLTQRNLTDCARSCISNGKLDTLVSIIEICKATDQNKDLQPDWRLCNQIAEAAVQDDNSKLAFFALEFLARWMVRGQATQPPVFLSVDEGLIVCTLATAGRAYDSKLLDASWAVLKRSLGQNNVANPGTYLAKIHAYAALGNLPKAFSTLNELETAHGNPSSNFEDDVFSPFTCLNPLVVACSKKGFETLDTVYYQLENLSRAEPPYSSVTALNCVILGCANTWDLDRAYQTFEAISSTFGLTPNVHSYNGLMHAFGKVKKTFEASRVFEHLTSLGVKPNATSYSLLIDAHLINRDPKTALSVVDEMVQAGFVLTRETLKKIRRRCTREMDAESNERVTSLATEHKILMAAEGRRDLLFSLDYGTEYAS